MGGRGAAPAQSVGFLLLAGPKVLSLAEDAPRLVADHLDCLAEDLLERASLPVAGALEGPAVWSAAARLVEVLVQLRLLEVVRSPR